MEGPNKKQFPEFIDIQHYPEIYKVVMKQLEQMEQTQQGILVELRRMNSDKSLDIKESQPKRTTKRK